MTTDYAVERLTWESDHFGVEVYRLAVPPIPKGAAPIPVLMDSFIDEARRGGATLLLARLAAKRHREIIELIDAGFQMADDMVTMRKRLESAGLSGKTRLRRADDVSESVLAGGFPHSRFETIPAFAAGPGSAGAYKHYVVPGVNGRIIETDGRLESRHHAGLTTWTSRADGSIGTLDLLVVAPRLRGRGYGRLLLADTLYDMQKAGCTLAETTTWLADPAAMALYRRAGFKAHERIQTWWKEL